MSSKAVIFPMLNIVTLVFYKIKLMSSLLIRINRWLSRVEWVTAQV